MHYGRVVEERNKAQIRQFHLVLQVYIYCGVTLGLLGPLAKLLAKQFSVRLVDVSDA